MRCGLEVIEQGDGPVLVLLHGAGVDAALWKPQIDLFSKQYHVIAPNLPGHGRSAPVQSVEEMADVVRAMLQEKGIAQYAIVGLSLGGMVAIEMAGRWPDEVSHLVTVESVATVFEGAFAQGLAGWAMLLFKVLPPSIFMALPASAMGAKSQDAGKYVQDAIAKMTAKNNYTVMHAASQYDGRKRLSNITANTLIMVGALNRKTHKRARKMANAIPESEFLVIPAASHIANLDAPDFFNASVLSFLS
ncbi:alpha/beta fold hydrolase [Tritonibacter scottomollicae]|uniref:alpha/beta fold hydrolase n=1 Tax=Tritonibacter scottomollicae TaxID=483013 RepID=UPI0029430DCF|nr:alpha/beta hydrolase [Tritonibacter scottomollicae]